MVNGQRREAGLTAEMRARNNPRAIATVIKIFLIACAPKTKAFGIYQQPSGLSSQSVASLAERRYNNASTSPMEGRVAVITGAAGGIGKELCKVVHSLGGKVVALDKNETGLELLRQSLSTEVICILTRQEDLTSVVNTADSIRAMFDKIDLLILNAGLTYNGECILGDDKMKSVHGKDLAFTVNYLSHFLLAEKLMPRLELSDKGRIVHVTSSYHWKVDGSELIPRRIGSTIEPLAYQSDPPMMSEKHIERSYGNTKLAQIWHSRCIEKCESVCACVSF